MPDLLERSRSFGEERPIFFDVASRREYRFREFLDLVSGLAVKLLERYQPGDRIAVMVSNGAEYFILRYALSCAGLIEVALNGSHRGPILRHMLRITQPRAIVVEERYLANLNDALEPGLEMDRISGCELRAMMSRPGSWERRPRIAINPTDASRIVFTSGTTGQSKGVELSHAYEVHTGACHVGLIGIGPQDRWLYVTPMFHIDAIYIASILFHTGGVFAVAPSFSVTRFWHDVDVSRATYLCHLGAILGLLLKGGDAPANSTLKVAVGGGASVPQIEEAERRFGIYVIEAFAMSECIACTINRYGERRMGTAGRAIKGYEVAIGNEVNELLPPGEQGEILVRSGEPSAIFTRYVGDSTATAMAMRGGWFHTGDLGDLDEDGYLTYRGRLKDAIRVKGENVSAMELEAIADLHPLVRRSAAVAVPSDIGDEDILLYVESTGGVCETRGLRAFIAERAAPFLSPRYIAVIKQLPLTATGKVDKSMLSRDTSSLD